jgi:sugar/nucleoside kinase (ribokinase family)
MPGILVAGDAMLDVHVTPAEPIRPGGDVPAVVRLGVGGQGANLAERLARRGLSVRLACAIGDDSAGPLVRERLSRSGVTVVPMPARATGSVVILLDPAGERTMLSERVPFLPAFATRLPELAATVDWVVVSGYLLEEAGERLTAPDTGGARRMLVGCPFRDVQTWRTGLEAFAPDLLILNRGEAAALLGVGDNASQPPVGELAASLAAAGLAGTAIVTDVTGVAAASPNARPTVEITIDPDAGVIDTTGAGDAFAATFLGAVHDAWPPEPEALVEALRHAASVATAVARVVGAQAAVEHAPGASA